MEEGGKPALVPRLRFPEFRETGGWDSDSMGHIYSFKGNNSLSRDKLNYLVGSVKNIHYGDIHTKFATHFDITNEPVPFINETELGIACGENFCLEGDMIFADASEDLDDIGKSIELIKLNGERLVAGLHTILARQTGDRIVKGFGGHLFKSAWVRSQIQREAQGAKVLGISANRLRNLLLPLPCTKDEQQKIAECLTSVDELIAAQARKVDALKKHKKGLMQDLFPRKGETQPRLRFPEFQDAREWEVRAVGDVFRTTRGQVLPMSSVNEEPSPKAPYPVYSSQTKNGGLAGYYSDYLFEDAITWTTDGANAGDVNFRSGQFYCTNVCGVLLSSQGYANACVAALLNSVTRSHVSYVGNPKLMNGVMAQIEIPFPPLAEQHRIANCLSVLDALIATEAQKLEAIKCHKRGLMQQLFPAAEEADG